MSTQPVLQLSGVEARDKYWLTNNRWGSSRISEGPAPYQFEQLVGLLPELGPQGEVAFRMSWRWPQPPGSSEVKAYPAIVSGCKPGYYRPGGPCAPANPKLATGGQPASGSVEGFFPQQLPLKPLKASFRTAHLAKPTGQGHLTFDLWLQSHPGQDVGFGNSSITHEIMIPLSNWGNYGGHNNKPHARHPGRYDHDVVLGGKRYHVYATKNPRTGAFDDDFGSLNGTYGRKGWKMIAFVPAQLPVKAGEIDLAAIVNHVATRSDRFGRPWATGREYLVSVELGVEPVVGRGDMVVHGYKLTPEPVPPQTAQRVAQLGAPDATRPAPAQRP